MISREMRSNTTIWFEKKRKRNEKRRKGKTLDDPLIISVRKTKWLRLCSWCFFGWVFVVLNGQKQSKDKKIKNEFGDRLS